MFCGFFVLLFPLLLYAEELSLSLPNQTIANADFRPGPKDKPALLLIHGFMSTYNLNIIQIIAEEEKDKYTVLAPNLTLNINNRRSGADCDAIHSHSMDDDVKEIDWWVNWLSNKGYKKIYLLGFSTGALQSSIYISKYHSTPVSKLILISPAYLAGNPFPIEQEKNDIATAKAMLRNNKTQLHKFSLSYCKGNFLSPPKAFLSYKKWTAAELIRLVDNITIPKRIILGGNDQRFGQALVEGLKKTDSKLVVISGANHFFDSPLEFEFLEKLDEAIRN